MFTEHDSILSRISCGVMWTVHHSHLGAACAAFSVASDAGDAFCAVFPVAAAAAAAVAPPVAGATDVAAAAGEGATPALLAILRASTFDASPICWNSLLGDMQHLCCKPRNKRPSAGHLLGIEIAFAIN